MGEGPNLASYTPYTHNLKAIFIHYVYCACVLTAILHMKSGMEFSIHVVMSVFKKFWMLDHFSLWIFRLGMLNLY
jgi:hypothetical protein